MKALITMAGVLLWYAQAFSQDTLFLKGAETIPVTRLKLKNGHYHFYTLSGTTKRIVWEPLVDSVRRKNGTQTASVTENQHEVIPRRSWQVTSFFSIGLGNNLSINDPSGLPDKTSLTLDMAVDLNANYQPEQRRFAITNELHYLLGMQKQGLSSGSPLQLSQDRLNTLHDASWKMGKKSHWNINAILKAATPLVTQYDGNYLEDITGLRAISGWLSPYDLTVAPGIKFQPNNYLRVSVSPYSLLLTGVRRQDVASKGLYITETDASGNYKKFTSQRLGAEVNLWFDRDFGDWLQMQYRVGITANYFEEITTNGLLDALFITRVKLVKQLFLTHRLTVQNSFQNSFFKPFLTQNILLSYSRGL